MPEKQRFRYDWRRRGAYVETRDKAFDPLEGLYTITTRRYWPWRIGHIPEELKSAGWQTVKL